MSIFSDLLGTVSSYFKIGLTGVRLKNNSGNLVVRNNADSADASVTTSQLLNSGESIVLNSDAAGSGADWTYGVARPTSGMSGNLVITLPPTAGSVGQVLQTDGSNNTSWVSAGSTAQCLTTDTTTINFGDGATVSAFTLPANAVIEYCYVVIDTPFDTAAALSVGIGANNSKYMPTTGNDLQGAAKVSYYNHPGEQASGSSESINVYYSAAGATAGVARVMVAYSVPN
jgi:hypothetical protein